MNFENIKATHRGPYIVRSHLFEMSIIGIAKEKESGLVFARDWQDREMEITIHGYGVYFRNRGNVN